MRTIKKKICENEFEHTYWEKNQLLVGIDEAGRGPLAGPLCVAGVVFPQGYENPAIYDSKALSEKKREQLYDVIMEDALWFEIQLVTESEIDRLNIYRATQCAMTQIAKDSGVSVILTDAMKLPEVDDTVIDLVKGDQKSISIAAGSILAKVTRDRIMYELDALYPQYGFAKNKGYPTKVHMEAIAQYGITPCHRRSYGPVAKYAEQLTLF